MNDVFEKVQRNWIRASEDIGFEILSPFSFDVYGKKMHSLAFLPGYGSRNGMILDLTYPPDYSCNNSIIKWASEHGCFYSFLNAHEFVEYDRDRYLDNLDDWGRFE